MSGGEGIGKGSSIALGLEAWFTRAVAVAVNSSRLHVRGPDQLSDPLKFVAGLAFGIAEVFDLLRTWDFGNGDCSADHGQQGSEDKDGELHGRYCAVRMVVLNLRYMI